MDPENSIELKNIFKTFQIFHEDRRTVYEYISSILKRKNHVDKLKILDDVSFSVKKGEVLGIIGFNGSGKTTLLRIIGKILVPDDGLVETDGKITPFLELGTGFNGDLTARDNIIIYGTILGFNKSQIREKINDIAKFAELERFLDTKLKNFSSGMNARLAFSTAIQVNPDIILVDEVLSVGDISFQQKSFQTFLDFKKRGKTILFVTHSTAQIEKFCDKALWLHEGKIKAFGEAKSVINEYRNFAENKT